VGIETRGGMKGKRREVKVGEGGRGGKEERKREGRKRGRERNGRGGQWGGWRGRRLRFRDKETWGVGGEKRGGQWEAFCRHKSVGWKKKKTHRKFKKGKTLYFNSKR